MDGPSPSERPRPRPSRKVGGLSASKVLGLVVVSGGVAYAVSDDARDMIDEAMGDIGEFFEDFNDSAREFFESIGDRIVSKHKEPWLLDLATLKYPENVPTLVIDLDKVILLLEHDSRNGWHVVKRPFAEQFFKEICFYYEVVLFSDDMYPVAEQVAFKWNLPVQAVLHREFCKKKRNHFVKDISKLGRQMDKVLIIDHDPAAFQLQPENGILIKEFDGDANDSELADLMEFLKAAATSNMDLRAFVARFGGGDVDIGRRYLLHKQDQDQKVMQRRSVGKYFSASRSTNMGQRPMSVSSFPR